MMPRRLVLAVSTAALAILTSPAFAQAPATPSLDPVIDRLRLWLAGLLVGLATLALTIGGVRYVTAAGDPANIERAKLALRSAAAGYALAALAPTMVGILRAIVGG